MGFVGGDGQHQTASIDTLHHIIEQPMCHALPTLCTASAATPPTSLSRGAGFVFTAKQNQPGLFTALDALPWTDTPIAHREIDHGHGRITTRTVQVRPARPTYRSRMSSRYG